MASSRPLDPSRSGEGWVSRSGEDVCIFNKLPQVILMWLVVQHTLWEVTQDDVSERKQEEILLLIC